MKLLVATPVALALTAGILWFVAPSTTGAVPDVHVSGGHVNGEGSLGADLYARHCAACHGVDGDGVDERGPSLFTDGPAAVDFVLRTGRMPLAAPNLLPRRGPVRFSDEEIVALVDYAGSFGTGPAVPEVDTASGDLANGGALYRLNCAACHVASGSGAAIGGGREAPSLMAASPTEIGEAILVGPGSMPVFGTFTEQDITDVAAYVGDLQDRDSTAPEELGGAGPVAEGLAAWLLGLLPLIALTRWLGTAQEGRDTPVSEGEHT